MMSSTRLLISILFSSAIVVYGKPTSESCDQMVLKADGCLRHLIMIGREKVVLPRSIADVDKYVCSTVNDDITCIVGARQCLNPFPRTLFNVAIRSSRNTVKKAICSNDNGKQGLVDALSCVTTPERERQMFSVLDKAAKTLDYIVEQSDLNNMMSKLCCTYQHTMSFVDADTRPWCPKGASFVEKIVSGIFGDAIDLGCGQFSNMNSCLKKFPDMMETFAQTFENYTERHDYSPLIPALRILNKLDTE